MYVMPRAIYTKDHNAIVKRLKEARIESGLGQIEVAKKLDISTLNQENFIKLL